MKTSKLFTINAELVELLSKTNASALVNDLLMDYFDQNEEQNIDVLRAKMAKKVAKKRLFLQEIAIFKQKIAKKQAEKETEKAKLLNSAEKEARKQLVSEMKNKWQNDQITDEEFYKFCDEENK